METIKIYRSNINNIEFGYLDENDDYVAIEGANPGELESIAIDLKTSTKLLEALTQHLITLRETLHSDLTDIWRKVQER